MSRCKFHHLGSPQRLLPEMVRITQAPGEAGGDLRCRSTASDTSRWLPMPSRKKRDASHTTAADKRRFVGLGRGLRFRAT